MHVGIIGGGAAGMTAAIFAAENGADVTILEHTARIGKKILSTGNGKCNFTNQNLSKDDYNGNHPSFVEVPLMKFRQTAAVDFFEKTGMLAVSKRDGYYYPATGQAATVLNMLRLRLESLGVRILTEEYILQAQKEADGTFFVKTKTGQYRFDKLILACGGNAAPATGSDGSGYKLAKAFGHSIVKPLPVLTYLKSSESSLKELAGVRTQAKLSLFVGGSLVQTEEGELQLNKDNISGIPVFQLSHNAILVLDRKKKVTVTADLIPDREDGELTKMLMRSAVLYKQLPISEVLGGLLHKKISVAVLRKAGIDFKMRMEVITEAQIQRLVSVIRQYTFEITGHPGFEAAQATMGGVDTSEVDENMMSKKVDGLYFAGEILDIDGRCGGYNLQWAWSSGYVAGCHCVNGEVTCYESISAK